jgi:hypothetical protein
MFQTEIVDCIKTHVMLKNFFFFENCAIYEIMWKSIAEPDRPQLTIWRKRIACWIPKATSTHSEYVILIAFSLPQWLHERASMLRYTYVACLVLNNQMRRGG